LKLKKIRLFKTPQGICCVVATSLLRATPSTMEPLWSQFNYFAIQERQFCLGLSYQDVLPSVSTKNEHGTLPQGNPGLSNPQRQFSSTLTQIKKARVA
tara:strand:+ start:1471 stop:1764 length:294 start_codon:yes stop_codon:yes gene_type:complete